VRGTEVARGSGRASRRPVLFISGYRTEEKSLPVGPDGRVRFLAKPFTGAALAETVSEMLEPALS